MSGRYLLIIGTLVCLAPLSCTQAYLDALVRKSVTEYRHQEAEKSILEQVSFTEEAHAAHLAPAGIPESTPEPFSQRHSRELLALASLFSLWLICRLDHAKLQRPAKNLDTEDLAIVRIIKSAASDILSKHKRRRRCKIIDLTTRQKGK